MAGDCPSMAEIRAANKACGQDWFSPGAVRFFAGRVHGEPICGPNGVFFVASSQFRSSTGVADPRRFTVQQFVDNCKVRTVGEFQEHGWLDDARAAARRAAGGRLPGGPERPLFGSCGAPPQAKASPMSRPRYETHRQFSIRCGEGDVQLRPLPSRAGACGAGSVPVEIIVRQRRGVFWSPDEPMCFPRREYRTAAGREAVAAAVWDRFESERCGGAGFVLRGARRRRRR